MDGIINIYKEQGYTSHDVIARMRGISGQRKAGHTGTLDPDAEGVLPVCLGTATRACEILTDKDKEYEAVLLIGAATDTEDISGEITQKADSLDGLTDEKIKEAVESFKGTYMQTPPLFSAIKKDGKKLCELARAGMTPEAPTPRAVTINDIEVVSDIVDCRLGDKTVFGDEVPGEEGGICRMTLSKHSHMDMFDKQGTVQEDRFRRNNDPSWVDNKEVLLFPAKRLVIRVACSKGTYIRSLCRDIGEKLGVCATMEKLLRTKVGAFGIESAVTLARAEELSKNGRLAQVVLATDECFKELPALHMKEKYDSVLKNGNIMFFRHFKEYIKEPLSPVRVYSSEGEFLAVYQYEERRNLYKPLKMFTTENA